MTRSRVLVLLAAALLLLVGLGTNVHIHELDSGGECRLCSSVPGPELPDDTVTIVVPLAPARAALHHTPPVIDTSFVAAPVRRRGPPPVLA